MNTFERAKQYTAELNAIMNPVDISEAVTTNPQVYTTVTFTLGSEEATRNFWIIVGVIAGLAAIVGIVFLIIKLKQWGIIKRKVPNNSSNNNYYPKNQGYKNNHHHKEKPKQKKFKSQKKRR